MRIWCRKLRVRTYARHLAVAGALLVATVGLDACSSGAAARDLTVSLDEWEVVSGVEELNAGKFVLTVTNEGDEAHELLVVKSDLPPADLDRAQGKVDEAQLNFVGRVAPLQSGATGTLELQLSPGKYVLLCNLVEGGESHYEAGMYAGLFVAP